MPPPQNTCSQLRQACPMRLKAAGGSLGCKLACSWAGGGWALQCSRCRLDPRTSAALQKPAVARCVPCAALLPAVPPAALDMFLQACSTSRMMWLGQCIMFEALPWVQAVSASQCAATSAQDGRWRAIDCGLQLRSACRCATRSNSLAC